MGWGQTELQINQDPVPGRGMGTVFHCLGCRQVSRCSLKEGREYSHVLFPSPQVTEREDGTEEAE